jgi:hypothetical protein
LDLINKIFKDFKSEEGELVTNLESAWDIFTYRIERFFPLIYSYTLLSFIGPGEITKFPAKMYNVINVD